MKKNLYAVKYIYILKHYNHHTFVITIITNFFPNIQGLAIFDAIHVRESRHTGPWVIILDNFFSETSAPYALATRSA